jgi:UPF0716 protein FxsA
MFRRLVLLFIVVPIAELALLIQVGRWIGLWPTLALIAVTGVIGATLASRERVPGRPILDGLSIFVGGALLLTPGLMTDLFGFTMLARPTRRWIQNRVVDRFGGRLIQQGQVFIRTSANWGRDTGRPRNHGDETPLGREIEPRDDS